MTKGVRSQRIVEGVDILRGCPAPFHLRLDAQRYPRSGLPLERRPSAPTILPSLLILIPVEAAAVHPALVRVGVEAEFPFHPGLVDHQGTAPGAPVIDRARVVGDEPLAGGKVLQLVQSSQKEAGPGHIATEVIAAESGEVQPPASEGPA